MKVAEEESRCGEVLAMMANAETLAMGSVLWRENPSLAECRIVVPVATGNAAARPTRHIRFPRRYSRLCA